MTREEYVRGLAEQHWFRLAKAKRLCLRHSVGVGLQVMSSSEDKAWKLKLRYGKLQTPFSHFTVLADGVVGDLVDGFECRRGPAIMAMKTWAESVEQSADMVRVIGRQIGFAVTGEIQVYETEPSVSPGDNPHGYDIQFTPFDAE